MRKDRISIVAMFIGAAMLSLSASAQEGKMTPDYTIGKKGVIHFNVPVKAGSEILRPGMYQLQHNVEGTEHFVSFKAMTMPAGYRHSNTPVAQEPSARVNCTVQPLEQKAKRTNIVLRTNDAGQKEVAEVVVAGEPLKHVF